jgi:hypothetical protein
VNQRWWHGQLSWHVSSLLSIDARQIRHHRMPPTGGLRRADAWAIALADELRGCVRLETDAERCGLQLIDSFEWITFVFDAKVDRGVVGWTLWKIKL